jgi:hypothetical protein
MDKKCFVICPIGEENSTERIRSDKLMQYFIQPIIEKCGFEKADRADYISAPGIITTQIIDRIVNDDLVIADLTGYNANVYYELALRHSIRKPVILLMEKGQRLPFDLAMSRTIFFDFKDIESIEKAKIEFEKQIKNIEKNEEYDNPISVAVDLIKLKSSSNPQDRSLAEITVEISQLRNSFINFSKNIDVIERLKSWEKITAKLDNFEEIIGNLNVDDLEEKIDALEYRVDDLESK